jgi:Secretion system C-terminal sorting domain
MLIQMKKYIFISLLLLFYLQSFAQNKYDYVWQMGYSYSRGPAPANAPLFGFQFNFNNGKTKIDTMSRGYDFLETVQSTCDSVGNYLFSSNGCKIFNKNFEIMENGDDLNQVPVSTFSNSCIVTFSQAEVLRNGALSLPVPNSKDSLFAFFRTEVNQVIIAQQNLLPLNLYYSEINMKYNNGLGKVIIKNKVIVKDTLDGGDIKAVKHANGKDWWVITRKFASNTFFTFRLSAKGIDSSFMQSIGEPTGLRGQGGGEAAFSPNGLKYAYFTSRDQLMLYDFDRMTGKLSNFKRIVIPFEVNVVDALFTGITFAPNSKFLYLFAITQIFQIDTDASDIQGNILQVARYDPVAAPYAFPTAGRLAPDCKIYFVSNNGIQLLGYIRYPDKKGTACQVVQGGIKLPYSVATVSGLPNNPNYRLGITPTYPCDSTIDFRVSTQDVWLFKINFVLFPNPATNELNIDFDPINGEQAEISLYNLLGSQVGQQKLDLISTPLSINVSNLPSGMYHAVLQIKGRSPAVQKFVIVR